MIEIKAPNSDHDIDHYLPRIFLAGSIEMGVAENWQTRVVGDMAKYDGVILNPRRDDWDLSLILIPNRLSLLWNWALHVARTGGVIT
jgi:hypothetical protein